MSNPQHMQCILKLYARSFSRLAFMLILALVIAGSVAAQVAPPVGPYGFVLNATFREPSLHGGAAMLGLMNFDGAGNVSGTYNVEFGSGGVEQQASITGSFTGTYSSNPDGTGAVSIALDDGDYLTVAMLIDDRGRGLKLAATSWCTGPVCGLFGAVVSGVGEAQFSGAVHPIRVGFLNGSYGLQFTKSSPTPFTEIAVWTFDGAGNVCTSVTGVGPGPNVQTDTRCGTYALNPDGTGTIFLPLQPGALIGQTWVFVISEGHSGLLVLQTNRAGDGVVYGTGRLQ